MNNIFRKLAVSCLIAVLLVTALAGAVFASDSAEVAITDELRSQSGALQIKGTADNTDMLFVAAYDAQGRMTEVHEATLKADHSWDVFFSGDMPADIRLFATDSDYEPAAAVSELQPALQVNGEPYWTMADAEAAADSAGKNITVAGDYYGPAAAEGYNVTLGENGDINNGKAFLAGVNAVFPLTNSEVKAATPVTLDGYLNRLASAYILADAARINVIPGASEHFTDVTDPTDAAVVAAVVNARMMNGTGQGVFMPDTLLTTEQAAALVCRGMGYSDIIWGQNTQKLESLGIAENGRSAGKDQPITQREFLSWLCKAANVSVTTEEDFRANVSGALVQTVLVPEDLVLTGGSTTCFTTINNTVTLAAGKTLTVAAYAPSAEDPVPMDFVGNFLTIGEGGSLTLENGAVLASTRDVPASENEPWHLYRGQINIEGGTLNAENGSISPNSFLAYEAGNVSLPADMTKPSDMNVDFLRIATTENTLRAGMTDERYTEVLTTGNITLTVDLTLTKLLSVQEGQKLIIPENKTLTVPEGKELLLQGELLVQGTLVNEGQINNNTAIDVIGGTLENSGRIDGFGESLTALEKSGTIRNYIGTKQGTINDEINLVFYYPTDGSTGAEPEGVIFDALEGDETFNPGINDRCIYVAATFSREQAQEALNRQVNVGTEDDPFMVPAYTGVLCSGKDSREGVVNQVELGGLTVPEGRTLVLKESLFDGTNTYHNSYVISENNTLIFEDNSSLLVRGGLELDIWGNIASGQNCRFVVKDDVTLGGKVVHNAEELKTAMANGGDIYLAPFPEAQQIPVPTAEGYEMESQYVLTDAFTVNTNTRLVPLGRIGVIAQSGFTVNGGATMVLDNGLYFEVQANSDVNGILRAVGNSIINVEQPENAAADAGRVTLNINGELDVGYEHNYGMLFIGDTCRVKTSESGQIDVYGYCVANENGQFVNSGLTLISGTVIIADGGVGGNIGYLINYGTIQVEGGGWFVNDYIFVNCKRVEIDGGVFTNNAGYYNGYRSLNWIDNGNVALYDAVTYIRNGGTFTNSAGALEYGAWDNGYYRSRIVLEGGELINMPADPENNRAAGMVYDNICTQASTEAELLAALNDPAINAVQAYGLTVNGDLEIPEGKRLEIPVQDWDADNMCFRRNVVTVTGNLILNGELSVEGWLDENKQPVGGKLAVNGKLQMGDNAFIDLRDYWDDKEGEANEGFKGYCGEFSANNVIISGDLDAQLKAAMTGGDGTYYLAYHPGHGYELDDQITVSHNVTVDGLRDGVNAVLNDTLTVNSGAALTIGNRMGFWADEVVNNGAIIELGWINMRDEDYSGNGVICYERNISQFAERFFDRLAGVQGLAEPCAGQPEGGWENYDKGNTVFGTSWKQLVQDNNEQALNGLYMMLESGLFTNYEAEGAPLYTGLNVYGVMDASRLKTFFAGTAKCIQGSVSSEVSDFIDGINLYAGRFFTKTLRTDPGDPDHRWMEWQLDALFDEFAGILSLNSADVTTEEEFINAVNTPYIYEIHVQDDITLSGAYYKDGEFVSLNEPEDENSYNESGCVYLIPAGFWQNEWREIVVEPGASLTVDSGVKLDIRSNVRLRIGYDDNQTPDDGEDDVWGELIIRGNGEAQGCVNVFGNLEPDEGDERRIILDGGCVNWFGDSNWFSWELYAVAAEYMTKNPADVLDPATLENYRNLDGWNEGNPEFTRLVAYGLTPETDGEHSWWNTGAPLQYGQMLMILTNVYKEAFPDATELPLSVSVGDEDWQPQDGDLLCNRDAESLLNRFMAVLPRETAAVKDFVLARVRDEHGDFEMVNGENNNCVSNQLFADAVTVSNSSDLENDDWGGAIRFRSCTFKQDITVTYKENYIYRVEFDENCRFENGAKVNVIAEAGASLLARGQVDVNFDCAYGNVVSSAPVNVSAGNNISFTFNGAAVSGVNAENVGNYASMCFNCGADHDQFDWERNDHSQCVGSVDPDYQFISQGTGTIKVSGSTAQNYPIRLSGNVDAGGLVQLEDQEITLHARNQIWNEQSHLNVEYPTNASIGGSNVRIDEEGKFILTGTGNVYVCHENADVTYNNVNLSPHVFGRDMDGVFLNMENVNAVPAYSLVRTEAWDDEQQCQINAELDFAAEYYNANDEKFTGTEQSFSIGDMVKVHLVPVEGKRWIDDPWRTRLTVRFASGSITYNRIQWKPVSVSEFVSLINEKLGSAYTADSLGLDEDTDENGELTIGSAKEILSAVWTAQGMTEPFDFHEIIRDEGYWDELNRYTAEPERNYNPDDRTIDWGSAEQTVNTFRNLLGLGIDVETADELLSALAEGYTTIRVVKSIKLTDGGNDDGNFNSCVYLNHANNVDDEQRIYVLPGMTLEVGGENQNQQPIRVKMDIQDGVRLILCADDNAPDTHAVLRVNKESCVNVFGALDTPPETDFNEYVEVDWEHGGQINFIVRVAEFGARLREQLAGSGKLLDDVSPTEMSAGADKPNWPGPDDDWGRGGMAFLVKYGGLTARGEGENLFWPSWESAAYGFAKATFEKIWADYAQAYNEGKPETEQIPAQMPGSVMPEDYWTYINTENPRNGSDGWCLFDNDAQDLIDRFMSKLQGSLPKTVIDGDGPLSVMLHRDADGREYFSYGPSDSTEGWETVDGNRISFLRFEKPLTILCDQTGSNDNVYVGTLSFQSCEFADGVNIEAADGFDFAVDFTGSCTGNVTVSHPAEHDGPEDYDPEHCDEWGNYCDRVTLRAVGGMNVTANTYTHIWDVRNGAFSLTTAAGTMQFAAADNDFGVDVRWDSWTENETNVRHFEPTVQINADAQRYDEETESGNGAATVSGTLSGKLRICGYIDMSALQTTGNGRIETAGERWKNNFSLGGNRVNVQDGGEYILTGSGATVEVFRQDAQVSYNGISLNPHVFGSNMDGVYLNMNELACAPTYTLKQGRDDAEPAELEFTVEYYAPGSNEPLTVESDDVSSAEKAHLIPVENKDWVSDPNRLELTVTLADGASISYYGLMWRNPISVSEFVERVNEKLGAPAEDLYTLSSLGLTNGDSELTIGDVKTVFTAVWNKQGEGSLDFHEFINANDDYWKVLEQWNDHENSDNPDNWTVSRNEAENALTRLCGLLGMDVREIVDQAVSLLLCRNDEGDGFVLRRVTDSDDPWEFAGGSEISDLRFAETLTIFCGSEKFDENGFVGMLNFRNCEFSDVIIKTTDKDFRVEFDENCSFVTGAKVSVAADEFEGVSVNKLDNRMATIFFGCTGGSVVSSAPVRVEAADGIPFVFDGATVSGTNAENGGFGAMMRFNCSAPHEGNDHSNCGGSPVPEYQFTSDGDASVTVAGSTAEAFPIRISGNADISALAPKPNQEVALHYWSHKRVTDDQELNCPTNAVIGSFEVMIPDAGEYGITGTGTVLVFNDNASVTLNDVNLGMPHIFGGNTGSIYIGTAALNKTDYRVKQGANSYDFNFEICADAGEVSEDNPAVKTHLTRTDGNWFNAEENDPVQLEADVGGATVIYASLHVNP